MAGFVPELNSVLMAAFVPPDIVSLSMKDVVHKDRTALADSESEQIATALERRIISEKIEITTNTK